MHEFSRFLTIFISFYFYFMSFSLHINLWIVVSVTRALILFIHGRLWRFINHLLTYLLTYNSCLDVRSVLYVLCCECLSK